jgi:hypothetical protein
VARKIQKNFRNFSRAERGTQLISGIYEIVGTRRRFDYNDLHRLNDDKLEMLERYLDAAGGATSGPGLFRILMNYYIMRKGLAIVGKYYGIMYNIKILPII